MSATVPIALITPMRLSTSTPRHALRIQTCSKCVWPSPRGLGQTVLQWCMHRHGADVAYPVTPGTPRPRTAPETRTRAVAVAVPTTFPAVTVAVLVSEPVISTEAINTLTV